MVAEEQGLPVHDLRANQNRYDALVGHLVDGKASGLEQLKPAYLHPLDVDDVTDVSQEVDLTV